MREFHPLANIFPLMAGQEFDAFAADVKEHGLREAIWLYEDKIIDGRNRYRACVQEGIEPKFIAYIGSPETVVPHVVSLNLHRRHLNKSQRAMVAIYIETFEHGQKKADMPIGVSRSEAAAMFNVGERTVARAKHVQERGTPDLIKAVKAGEITVSDAASIVDEEYGDQNAILADVKEGRAKNLKAAKRKHEIAALRQAIESGDIALPEGVFEVIAIDPPWPYKTADQYDSTGFRGGTPYPEMELGDLAVLKLPAADNCVLWLWTTHRFMFDAGRLLDVWGFEHKSIVTWVKHRMGTGRWLRSQSEFCIMAVRGKPTIDLTNQTTVLHAPMREHSRKPDEFYEMVESLCVGHRLDFFSREKRDGWEQMGNEPDKFEGAA